MQHDCDMLGADPRPALDQPLEAPHVASAGSTPGGPVVLWPWASRSSAMAAVRMVSDQRVVLVVAPLRARKRFALKQDRQRCRVKSRHLECSDLGHWPNVRSWGEPDTTGWRE